jgi:hypothetical protein
VTIQIDTGQVTALAFSVFGGPALVILVQEWRRRRREQDAELVSEANRLNEARDRQKQHTENSDRMDEITRALEAAFGVNGRRGFVVHRQEFDALQSAHASDHGRLNGHATVIEAHKEQIFGLRRDVDELRRAD